MYEYGVKLKMYFIDDQLHDLFNSENVDGYFSTILYIL